MAKFNQLVADLAAKSDKSADEIKKLMESSVEKYGRTINYALESDTVPFGIGEEVEFTLKELHLRKFDETEYISAKCESPNGTRAVPGSYFLRKGGNPEKISLVLKDQEETEAPWNKEELVIKNKWELV